MRLHENRDLFSDALQAASQPIEDADQENSQKHDERSAGNGYAWFYEQGVSLSQGILFLSKSY